jgi:hypothetical protein
MLPTSAATTNLFRRKKLDFCRSMIESTPSGCDAVRDLDGSGFWVAQRV